MSPLVTYFEQIPSSHRSLILISGILFFWLIESNWPLFKFNNSKIKHAGLNIFFTITTILVNFPLAFILVKSSDWAIHAHFGVLEWLPTLPLWGQALIGLLFLDLIGAWFAHWIQHQVKWLWQFHLIHHTDHFVDTTTANRHHPGESFIRFFFTVIAILITGAPMWIVFLYQSMSVILSQFNHANFDLPRWINRPLSRIIVTPNMHHIHHHFTKPYTDSNYGNIFAIWDHLFGTYRWLEQDQIHYGVDTYPDVDANGKINNLLKIPFQAYRPSSDQEATNTYSKNDQKHDG